MNFGSLLSGSKPIQTKSGCPSSLQVFSSKAPWIEGQYEITNQTRRGQPVWYNKEKQMFLLVAKSKMWHIKNLKSYNSDDNSANAYSATKMRFLNGKLWCPQHFIDNVWVSEKWTKDIVVLGEIKLDLHVKV